MRGTVDWEVSEEHTSEAHEMGLAKVRVIFPLVASKLVANEGLLKGAPAVVCAITADTANAKARHAQSNISPRCFGKMIDCLVFRF